MKFMSVPLRKWPCNDIRFKTIFADSMFSLRAEQTLERVITVAASSPIHKTVLERNIDKTIKAEKLQTVWKT